VTRYDRMALVFDGAASELGTAALRLVVDGLDPLYASDEDELQLLAREHAGRIAALVLPGELPLPRIEGVLKRVEAGLRGLRPATVVVAPPRQRAFLGGLRERGVRWVVFAPYDASELRFAVAAALSSGDALEPRRGLRVPIHLPVSVRHARVTRSAEIANLAIGGAFVAIDEPPEPGAALLLEFPIGERLLRVQAVVAHRSEQARPLVGMGVAFTGLSALDERMVEGFVRERIDAFRL
jgi:hypothetical protein